MTRSNFWLVVVLGLAAACGESDSGGPAPAPTGGSGAAGNGGAPGTGGAPGAGTSGTPAGGAAGNAATGGNTSSSGAPSSGGSGADAGGSDGNGSAGDSSAAGGDGVNGSAGDGNAVDLPEQVSAVAADKIDLLFVIDNSISMADKQEIFRDAVPLLVQRLVTPVCVDANGEPTGTLADNDGQCASGEPEFPPLEDIHVGVITSSLGTASPDVCFDPLDGDNDKAHLLPSVRDGLASWDDSGFLAWDPEQTRNDPPGQGDAAALVSDFQDMVVAAGETGCGYEATLEAWYRFLVDPDPPSSVALDLDTHLTVATYPDELILAQRAAFLRPDSLVGIVLLTDENDCSIIDGGQAHAVSKIQSYQLPRSTSACAADPDDPCCTSCALLNAPSGCPALADDPECQKGAYTPGEDSPNLRCFDQKRRFGFDMLQPIKRYVDGLTSVEVVNRSGNRVQNPLFAAAPGALARDLSRVFLLGIVGVPWQDVADEESQSDARVLRYLSHQQLVEEDRWSLLLGEDGQPPGDALLLETPLDRSTLGLPPHPFTGESPIASTSTTLDNRINGHEFAVLNDDLQYSCIFPLATPKVCADDASACDCRSSDSVYNRPICDGTTQTHAKAYPPVRELELLRAFGDLTGNAVVASICPKVTESDNPSVDPDYGYNPAVAALVDRMKSAISPTCLGEALEVDADERVACELLEVTAPMAGSCQPCDGGGRGEGSPSGVSALRERLSSSRYCGQPGQPDCDDLCVCGITQLEGDALEACQTQTAVPANLAGFCYVDAAEGVGEPGLVRDCPVGRKRRLRLLGAGIPRSNATSFVMCDG